MRTYQQFGQRSQRKHQMPDPASTSAGSAALLKMFGIHISAGALAAALGFLVLWPRTMKEGFARLFCTIVAASSARSWSFTCTPTAPSCSSPPRWWPGSTS